MNCPKCGTENSQDSRFCKSCATPLPGSGADRKGLPTQTLETPVPEIATGTTLAGRYQVIEELGHGGMGKVYKVLDTDIKEKIALKLLRPEIALDKETVERFSNELKLARKISHRNVCRMFDLGKAEGMTFITMEFVPGEDLKSFIHRSRQLNTGTAVSIAKEVCEGLAEAHRLGIVHRDLKPGNIMIDREGNAKIMDFGIARSLRGKGITGAGVMIGTPEYMSPEQVEGKDADQRSDIYSLGIILYEMVTGRPPFEGDTPLSVAQKQKYEAPQDPRLATPQIPGDLRRAILLCLEKDRGMRYQSAEDLRADLEKIEGELPAAGRETSQKRPLTSREITVTFKLKKLFPPAVAVAVLVLAGVLLWQVFFKKAPVSQPSAQASVAVLPFVDLSPQKDHAWLSDGISEALINALSRLKELRVPARTSSFFFKEKKEAIQDVGRMLKVENVLEGSVQVAGDTLRVTAELISVKDGYQLWSDKFDRRLEDVFAIQDDIAREIIRSLKVRLLGDENAQLGKKYTKNLEAYNLYLRGRFLWNKRTREDMKKSVEYFRQAIEKDPEYALAHAGLADGYILLGSWGILSPTESFPESEKAALRALEIDPLLAEAHTALAFDRFAYDWDWNAAESGLKRALEINPNYAVGHQFYSEYLFAMGRIDEALTEIRRAQELDPLSLIISAVAGRPYFMAGQYDRAIEQYQKTLEMDPDFRPAHVYLGDAYLLKRMYQEALSEFEIAGDRERIGLTYAKMGQPSEARRILTELNEKSKHEYVRPSSLALIHFALGEIDQGFALLEKGCATRDYLLSQIKVSPWLSSIHADPRFKSLIKKMNLERP